MTGYKIEMKFPKRIGGVIHTYQKYDPKHFPSPTRPPPDLVSGAMEHMLAYGSLRELTEEELARAVRIDPSQIAGLGPSLDALIDMLRERKRKILQTISDDNKLCIQDWNGESMEDMPNYYVIDLNREPGEEGFARVHTRSGMGG